MIAIPTLAIAAQAVLSVGGGGAYPSITAALHAAAPWDTVLVSRGTYDERLVIDRPVVLVGGPGAVIDGGGTGVVVTVHAPAVVRGFVIRASGASQSLEHAGLLAVGADGLIVAGNRFEDVLFGVYVKETDGVVIRHNTIIGKDLDVPRRGDGIRLWYSHGGLIEHNDVRRSRDVVIWFSNDTRARDNTVADSRYGLHYMYSDRNTFTDNRFTGNHVGAFIMYSEDITFRDNLFADARGTTGRGLGFKDADRITAEGNVLVKNAVGISIDNSPTSEGVTNRFVGNVIAFNDVGIALLPSVHSNVFLENDFLDNVQPAVVTGGGSALANTWRHNYWTEYAGFDGNDDGLGDTPFVFERLSDDLLARHDALKVFNLSLAAATLNTLSRVFPLLQPEPIVVDSAPRLEARGGENVQRAACSVQRSECQERAGSVQRAASVLFLTLAVVAWGTAWRARRPRAARSA